MKYAQTIIFPIIIFNVICECDWQDEKLENEEYSVDNCRNANKGSGYCCYVETPKSKYTKDCESLTIYQYDHINIIVKNYKIFGGDGGETEDKDVKIDCNSLNLCINSLILILLFFL
jgi:hypothetical protein